MWLEDHFGSGSMLQRNERVKLAASFWNNTGAGMVIGGMAAAFFLDKPQGTWTIEDRVHPHGGLSSGGRRRPLGAAGAA